MTGLEGDEEPQAHGSDNHAGAVPLCPGTDTPAEAEEDDGEGNLGSNTDRTFGETMNEKTMSYANF